MYKTKQKNNFTAVQPAWFVYLYSMALVQHLCTKLHILIIPASYLCTKHIFVFAEEVEKHVCWSDLSKWMDTTVS